MCIAYKKKKERKEKRKNGEKKGKRKKKDRKEKRKDEKKTNKKRTPYPPELSLSVGRAPMYYTMYVRYGTLISV